MQHLPTDRKFENGSAIAFFNYLIFYFACVSIQASIIAEPTAVAFDSLYYMH